MKNIKKILAGFLAVALIATGLYIVPQEAEEVKATEITENGAAVDPAMLNVKVQAGTGTLNNNTVNALRFITSVNSLDYAEVGFNVDGTDYKVVDSNGKNNIVYERIESSDAGMKYEFSPKVVDTSSEYFATAKMNVTEKESTRYTVKAYVKTFEDEIVYGPSRCVSYNDAATTEYITMSFVSSKDVTTDIEGVTSSASEDTYTATVIGSDVNAEGKYNIHVTLPVNPNSLPSATKFTFEDYGSVVYRNLYTSHVVEGDTSKINADTTWHDVDTTANDFVIATGADLYGLASIVDNGTQLFANKTIYVVSDIAINSTGDKTYAWNPIATTEDKAFAGVFDGQMHEISGIHINISTATQGVGLFGHTGDDSSIQKMKLMDSTVTSTNAETKFIGSVVGCSKGDMSKVYSNATVVCAGPENGGVIGRIDGLYAHKISEVWFDGSVTSTATPDISCIGGVIGRVYCGQNVMENCLNTGSITHNVATEEKVSWTGGLVGGLHYDSYKTTVNLEMNHCLNTGKVITTETGGVGTIIGRAREPITFVNVYTSNDVSCNGSAPAAENTVAGVGNHSTNSNTLIGAPEIKTVAQLSGAQARYNTTFDFYLGAGSNGTWVARNGQETKDKMPGLKAFVNESAWYVTDEVMVADKSWYTNNTSATTFEIGTAAELLGVAELTAATDAQGGTGFSGKTIKLTNDIVFNNGNKDDWDTNAPVNEWITIGNETVHNFLGSFDGQGHTISGIYLNAEVRYSGFFGPVTCPGNQTREIKDFRLVNSYMTESSDTLHMWYGGIIATVGANSGGQVTISDIYTDVEIDVPEHNDIGGIVGRITGNNTKIERCQFDGKLTFNQYGGGIFSRVDASGITVELTDCLSSGTIYAEVNNAGGLCGGTALGNGKNNHLNLTDCVSDCTMDVYSIYVSGSLVGRVMNTDTVHVDNVYTSEKITPRLGGTMIFKPGYRGICVNASEGTIVGDAATVVIDENTSYELNRDFWQFGKDNIPHMLRYLEGYTEVDREWYDNNPTASSYTLSTPAQLFGLAEVSKETNFEGQTINLGANITFNSGNAFDWGKHAPLKEWPQIGSVEKPFKGIFNGNNHTISGIYVNAENQYAGLFAAVEGADCEIKNFKLVNSYFTSSCTVNDIYLGSIAGRGNAKFMNIYSSAYVHANTASTTAGQVVGGLVGGVTAGTYSKFEQCQYAGSLRFHWYGGGILGIIQNSGTKVIMTNCLSTASIYSEMHNTGGVCGNVSSGTVLDINHCVSDLTSMSVPSAFCSGSVISRVNGGTATIANVYTTNNVVRRDNGGLPDLGYAGIVGIGTGAGGTITNNVGPTKISSTTTYNLDTSIWTIGTDDVPYLTQFAQ